MNGSKNVNVYYYNSFGVYCRKSTLTGGSGLFDLTERVMEDLAFIQNATFFSISVDNFKVPSSRNLELFSRANDIAILADITGRYNFYTHNMPPALKDDYIMDAVGRAFETESNPQETLTRLGVRLSKGELHVEAMQGT